jgi:hypothetical protein
MPLDEAPSNTQSGFSRSTSNHWHVHASHGHILQEGECNSKAPPQERSVTVVLLPVHGELVDGELERSCHR